MKTALLFTVSTRCLYESVGEAISKQCILTENFFTLVLSEILGQVNMPVVFVADDTDLLKNMDALTCRFNVQFLSVDKNNETILEILSSVDRIVFVDIFSCFLLGNTLQSMLFKSKNADIVCLNKGVPLVANHKHAIKMVQAILSSRLQTSIANCLASYLNAIQWQGVLNIDTYHNFETPFHDNGNFSSSLRSYQNCILKQCMQRGLAIVDPTSIDLRGLVRFEKNVFLDNNVSIRGEVILGNNVSVGANCILENITVKADTQVKENCILKSSEIGRACRIGPYARLRSGTKLGDGSHIGNFVEIKNTQIGMCCKINHHSFIGDATIADSVIIGAGTVTCNFDGLKNNQTILDSHVFIGSGVQLIAPLRIFHHAFVAAGSTITRDVPCYCLAIARAKQIDIDNWVRDPQQRDNG